VCVCGVNERSGVCCFEILALLCNVRCARVLARALYSPRCRLQDDTYTESYISTIGVDFVSDFRRVFDLSVLRFCDACRRAARHRKFELSNSRAR
jgi:hypothetical protein